MNDFELRWQVLCEARSDKRTTAEAFVYAVLTTGVYCRPGCRSRLPRKENVRFFETALAAQQAGYRACKRCRPELGRSREHDIIEQACRRIEGNETLPSLSTHAHAAGLSTSRFHKLFKATLGVTPKQYAVAYQRGQLHRALQRESDVTRAIHGARYSSTSRVYGKSGTLLGMSPSVFARRGEGERIRWVIERCSLGRVLVAATARGVCAVELANSERDLVRSFERRFGRATKTGSDARFRAWVKTVLHRIDQPSSGASPGLPLDIRGTAFQQRVWAALARIPRGQTTSYSELAASLGAPRAARAVAGACAANSLAVVVPCHRVLRQDGGLGGYRWGLDAKRRLLSSERTPREHTTLSRPQARG